MIKINRLEDALDLKRKLRQNMMTSLRLNTIYQGDTYEVLKTFPDNSIDMVITSPPYYALRDYGVEGQLGLESTFQEYITKLCNIFDEVKRVLKPQGTCWVNLGDSYGGTCDKGEYKDPKNPNGRNGQKVSLTKNVLQKCLLQIPSRFAIEMTNRGWILRNEIIWHKPNCMPSSVKDRFTVDFEKLFFFTKSKKYYFETQFEALTCPKRYEKRLRNTDNVENWKRQEMVKGKAPMINPKTIEATRLRGLEKGRNKRCVWSITTKPFKGSHFAVFPPELVETPIKAGCPIDGIVLDIFMGSGTTGLVAKKLGRNYIGIELNEEYIKMAEERINK